MATARALDHNNDIHDVTGGDSMTHGCSEFRQQRLHRRHVLKIGAFGLAGVVLPGVSQANPPRARARSVIFLYQFGGPSHRRPRPAQRDARRLDG
jgi:hypothetical protein